MKYIIGYENIGILKGMKPYLIHSLFVLNAVREAEML